MVARCEPVRHCGTAADGFTWDGWSVNTCKPSKAAAKSVTVPLSAGLEWLGIALDDTDVGWEH